MTKAIFVNILSVRRTLKQLDAQKNPVMTMRLLVVALLSLHSVSAFFPYFRTFTYTRRPARPHNPIIVQADRVKVRADQIKISWSF